MDDVPTATAWTLYAHFACTAETYASSYMRMCTVASFSDFWRMWHHTHPDLIADTARAVAIGGRPVTAWSFFRDGSVPEWEHPTNAAGKVVPVRAALAPDDATRIWQTLLMQCVLGTHPSHLNGVQITRKSTHVRAGEPGLFMKVDVWLDKPTDEPTEWIREHTTARAPERRRRR